MESRGYYLSNVSDSTVLSGKRATVHYLINPGLPYTIRNISYIIEDTTIRNLVVRDSINSLVKRNSRFDSDMLREERKRIENLLREEGYFFFSRDFINFKADTNLQNRNVELEVNILNRFTRNQFGERIPQTYKKYQINKVFVYPNFDPVNFYHLQQSNLLDTVLFKDKYFVYHNNPGIRLKTISSSSFIAPNQLYSESIVRSTRNSLSALRLYRVVNVFFNEDLSSEKNEETNGFNDILFFKEQEESDKSQLGKLNCYIQLTPHTLQSYQVDLVGTNSSSDIGVEGNINYQHKNIFRGAETMDIKLRGMMEIIAVERNIRNALEYGGSVGFGFPRLISPFFSNRLVTSYYPRTQVSASYNYQDRPQYTRTIAGLNLNYSWRGHKRFTHIFTPTEISIINIFEIDPSFASIIKNTYLEQSYVNQVVTVSGYSLIFNTQVNPRENFSVVRFNFEVSGNILNGIYSLLGKEKADDDTYKLFNISFSQFVRSDINYIYNQIVDDKNTLVYRVYAGAGFPYGNSKALPFEKKYSSGGSIGVRGWHARGLGPGTYTEPNLVIPNQTADIKFEANIEYRFKLFWMLQGALFFDTGNIWSISKEDERPGALFELNKFYKQLAFGSGTGLRMDLGFFAIRFDVGVKVFVPSIEMASDNVTPLTKAEWIPFDRPYNKSDFVLHFGIGYPF